MDHYQDFFRVVLELSDSKAVSTAYFVLVATCVTVHTYRVRMNVENQQLRDKLVADGVNVSPGRVRKSASSLKIYYLDGCHLSLDVTEATTLKEICSKICLEHRLGLYEAEEELGPLNEQTLLPHSMTVGELISRWSERKWPDAKLIAPVYLRDWAYKLSSRALRQVRFENSYLTQTFEYSPSTSDVDDGDRKVVLRGLRPSRGKGSGNGKGVRGRSKSRGNSPEESSVHSPPTVSSSSNVGAASTRARERTHALLNTLFTTYENTDPRLLSSSVTERSWEDSLRRSTYLPSRKSAHSPMSTASSVSASSPPFRAMPLSPPIGAPHTSPAASSSPSATTVTGMGGSIMMSPDGTTPVQTRATSHRHGSGRSSNNTAASSTATTNSSAARVSSDSESGRAETPDKIRPRTTVVHLHREQHDHSTSGSHSRCRRSPEDSSSPSALTASAASPPVAAVGVDSAVQMLTAALHSGEDRAHDNKHAIGRESPATTVSAVTSTNSSMASMAAFLPHSSPSPSTPTSSNRFNVSSSDLATHTAHARTNALLNKLFATIPDSAKDGDASTPAASHSSSSAECNTTSSTPLPPTSTVATNVAELSQESLSVSGVKNTPTEQQHHQQDGDNERTEQDTSTPLKSNQSPGSTGASIYSRASSPGALSIGSTTSAGDSVKSGGAPRRRKLRAPVERPPFDASTSTPTLSMLLSLHTDTAKKAKGSADAPVVETVAAVSKGRSSISPLPASAAGAAGRSVQSQHTKELTPKISRAVQVHTEATSPLQATAGHLSTSPASTSIIVGYNVQSTTQAEKVLQTTTATILAEDAAEEEDEVSTHHEEMSFNTPVHHHDTHYEPNSALSADVKVRLFSRRGSTSSASFRNEKAIADAISRVRRGSVLSPSSGMAPSVVNPKTPHSATVTPNRQGPMRSRPSPHPIHPVHPGPSTTGDRNISPYTTTLRGSVKDRSTHSSIRRPSASPAPSSAAGAAAGATGVTGVTARVTTGVTTGTPGSSRSGSAYISPYAYSQHRPTASSNGIDGEQSHGQQRYAQLHDHDVAFMRRSTIEHDTAVSLIANRARSVSPHSTVSAISVNSGSNHSRQGSARRGANRSTTNWIP